MINFFSGIVFMYVLGLPLLLHISEPIDEDNDPNAHYRFALMWPLVALEVIYHMIRGERDDDGAGTN